MKLARILLLSCLTLALAAPVCLGKDIDDLDGVPQADQAKKKKTVETIIAPDGHKIYIDHQAGTWRDDSGHQGKVDQGQAKQNNGW
jgi:hypothetical protein